MKCLRNQSSTFKTFAKAQPISRPIEILQAQMRSQMLCMSNQQCTLLLYLKQLERFSPELAAIHGQQFEYVGEKKREYFGVQVLKNVEDFT